MSEIGIDSSLAHHGTAIDAAISIRKRRPLDTSMSYGYSNFSTGFMSGTTGFNT
jgi:hypothetical protein